MLEPEDHALALETMRYFGRLPMSFTHGDFEYLYLRNVAVKDGRRRFERLDFAVHFDVGMRGRKGAEGVETEVGLGDFRREFVDKFRRLKREHGVKYYLAHNMTVQQSNLGMLAEAVTDMRGMGFRMLSFQPAAMQGNERRWVKNLREVKDDDGEMIWREIESGMKCRLPYELFQMGDVRCNRMCVLGAVGMERSVKEKDSGSLHLFPLFDDRCKDDVHLRDLIMKYFGNIVLPPHLLVVKTLRVFLRRPFLFLPAISWLFRLISRAGGIFNILFKGIQPLTIVMHRFMDAADVNVAWDFMESGVPSDDPAVDKRIRETMERLGACSYAMAQPERGRVVPACVQHSVYDEEENVRLSQQLKLRDEPRQADREAVEKVTRGEV